MRKLALTLLLSVALVGVAAAGDEAPTKELKRGFQDGKFVDEYFGITYAVDGLAKGFGFGQGGDRVLFSGKLPGNADVEVLCNESPDELTSAQWRDRAREQMENDGKTRTEMATGDDPAPSITFVQESFAGFARPHGYAFYARGRQCFVVHVQVREKSDASPLIVGQALGGLTVAPSAEPMLAVHVFARRMNLPLDDPKVLLQAGQAYLQKDHQILPLAMRALSEAQAREDELDDAQRYLLHQQLGFAHLEAKALDEAVADWTEAVALAAKLENAAAEGNAQYNLACALSQLGRVDEAFGALEAAFEKGSAEAIAGLKQHAQEDPDLEALRTDARWAEVTGAAESE